MPSTKKLVNYDCRSGDVISFQGHNRRVAATWPGKVFLASSATVESEDWKTYEQLLADGAYYVAELVPVGMLAVRD